MRRGIVTDKNEKYYVSNIMKVIFTGKQNIPWNDVENYLKQYIGETFVVEKYQDKIQIAGDFPNEYAESKYTKSLRGAVSKAKANAAQIIGSLIIHATDKRWLENKNEKHDKNAAGGWYRYETRFAMPVQSKGEEAVRYNAYRATLVIRKTSKGMFLYDMINIKKEASTPLESK